MSSISRYSLACLLVIVLILSIATSTQYNQKGWLPSASAHSTERTITFNNLGDASNKIYYLTAERPESLDIIVQNSGNQLAHEGTGHLPEGIWVTPKRPTAATEFVIHIDENIRVEEDQMPITFGMNFYDPKIQDSLYSILFVIESKDAGSRPLPIVTFDKQMYSPSEVATLTVNDPQVDCKVPETLPDGEIVRVDVTLNAQAVPGSPFNVQRDINSNNEFRLTFPVPEGNGPLEARYVPTSDCLFPPRSTGAAASDSALVSNARISFDKRNYAYQDTAVLTLVDDVTQPSPVRITATKNIGGAEVPVEVASTFRSVILPATPPVANTFTLSFRLDQLFTADNFEGGLVTVTATYGDDARGAQDVITVLLERKLSFVIPDDRTSLFTNDTASIEFKYPEWNTDPREFDTGSVTLCAYQSEGAIDRGRTVIPVAETGRNTGIFVNSYYLDFVNADFSIPGDWTPEDRQVFEQSNVRVLLDKTTTMVARAGDMNCPPNATPSANFDTLVTVLESEASDPDGVPGKGQNVGAAAHFNPPLYSVSQVNCNQYNYGPDTDEDGICDNWETTSGLKLYYPAGGGSWTLTYTNDPAPKPDHKDIFVEMDYVDNLNISGCDDGRTADGNNYKPSTAAVNNVEAAFRAAPVVNDDGFTGVELHIYVDDKVNSGCLENVRTWGEDPQEGSLNTYDEIKEAQFGRDNSERLTQNKGKAKFQVFHYGLSVPKQSQDMPSSGVAEQLGNDFVVSLGASGIGWSDANMGGTIMHELGHNLGLYHGGPNVMVGGIQNDYNVNCKPNYPSVMSYIRQITNPYSNTTLKYSDDVLQTSDNGQDNNGTLSQPLIYRTDPDEGKVLKLTSSSWMSLVELVWGIDPPPAGGSITVLSGDSTKTPAISGDAERTWSGIDWNGDTTISNGTSPDGQNIAKLGISGCSGSDTDNKISGADDWANLKYDFRTLNPDAFETGFGPLQYYPLEVNTTIVSDIRVKGINTTDYLVGTMDDGNFTQDISCSDVLFSKNKGTFEVEDDLLWLIIDPGANKNKNSAEEPNVKISSSSDAIGKSVKAKETGPDTGLFVLGFNTTASMNTTNNQITVKDGDEVTIEYTDACSAGPTKIGSDFTLTYIVGGTDADIVTKEIRTVGQKVKAELSNKLVNGSHVGDEEYLTGSASNSTLIELVRNDLEAAVQELLAMRKFMDGSAGGNKSDDLFKDDWASVRAREFLDNNIASLRQANLSDNIPGAFNITSYDFECGNGNQSNSDGCIIYGYSESATATADTFSIDPKKKRITLDLVGQADVNLHIPRPISENGIFFVRSYVRGGEYNFNVTAQNATFTTLNIEDLALYPRYIAIFYGPDLVSSLPVRFLDLNGTITTELRKGEQVEIGATLVNFGAWQQNATAIIEIRDANDTTQFLAWQNASLRSENQTDIGVSWMPVSPGVYTVRIFTISDLENPQILSGVKALTVEVDGTGQPEFSSPRTEYAIGETISITMSYAAANGDPTTADSPLVKVASSSDTVGLVLSFEETADNTGIFELEFETTATNEAGKLAVRSGDAVTVEYTDEDGTSFVYLVKIA